MDALKIPTLSLPCYCLADCTKLHFFLQQKFMNKVETDRQTNRQTDRQTEHQMGEEITNGASMSTFCRT